MEAEKPKFKQPILNEEKEVVYEQHEAKLQISTSTADQSYKAIYINTVTTGGGNDYEGISHQNGGTDGKNKELLPAPGSLIPDDSSSSSSYVNPPNEPVGIAISPTEEVREIYLKQIYITPPNHEFYCPNCKVCIEKVLFCKVGDGADPPTIPVRCSACFSFLVQKGGELITGLLSLCAVTCIPIPDPSGTTTPAAARSSKKWEVLKSIVYGGLAELLASLSVVTSAASADATTLSIVALAIANLIGGLFLLVHNLRDLKATKPIEEESEPDAPPVDKYYELLGKREHFYLHAIVAIISFLIFGLLPPLVYGFAFRESDDKDLKLAAVAVASLIGITLLSIAKGCSQKQRNSVTYFKTVFYYVTSGVLASLLTYVAGALMKRLVEQLGWFEPKTNIGLSLNEMNIENPRWGYY